MNDIVVSNKNKKDGDSTSVPEAVSVAGSDELCPEDVLSRSPNEHYDVRQSCISATVALSTTNQSTGERNDTDNLCCYHEMEGKGSTSVTCGNNDEMQAPALPVDEDMEGKGENIEKYVKATWGETTHNGIISSLENDIAERKLHEQNNLMISRTIAPTSLLTELRKPVQVSISNNDDAKQDGNNSEYAKTHISMSPPKDNNSILPATNVIACPPSPIDKQVAETSGTKANFSSVKDNDEIQPVINVSDIANLTHEEIIPLPDSNRSKGTPGRDCASSTALSTVSSLKKIDSIDNVSNDGFFDYEESDDDGFATACSEEDERKSSMKIKKQQYKLHMKTKYSLSGTEYVKRVRLRQRSHSLEADPGLTKRKPKKLLQKPTTKERGHQKQLHRQTINQQLNPPAIHQQPNPPVMRQQLNPPAIGVMDLLTQHLMSSVNSNSNSNTSNISPQQQLQQTILTQHLLNTIQQQKAAASTTVSNPSPQAVQQQQNDLLTHHLFNSLQQHSPSVGQPVHHAQLGGIMLQQNHHHQAQNTPIAAARAPTSASMKEGRRAIRLRLVEDIHFGYNARRNKNISMIALEKISHFATRARSNSVDNSPSMVKLGSAQKGASNPDFTSNMTEKLHGTITVSWYHGTTTSELQTHVRNSVSRKINSHTNTPQEIVDAQLLDETVMPSEEIVLTPYIPDGSTFLLKFRLAKLVQKKPVRKVLSYGEKAPDSPSAAPSPKTSSTDLRKLAIPSLSLPKFPARDKSTADRVDKNIETASMKSGFSTPLKRRGKTTRSKELLSSALVSTESTQESSCNDETIVSEKATKTQEKVHVIFVLSNYFVLFLSIITISAEIHDRVPDWLQNNIEDVEKCGANRDTLFECVNNGELSGLFATLILWISNKNFTSGRRVFLFGFQSVNKLWEVVYESLITGFCWGLSYMFVRRGLNPDTRDNFLEKYWKDAVYGSMAGFNAGFLKAVLKNLIPREAIEDAAVSFEQRHLRIVDWLLKISPPQPPTI